MKQKMLYLGILSFIVCITPCRAQKQDFSTLTGPYLGQIPLGETSEVFVPGFIPSQKDGTIEIGETVTINSEILNEDRKTNLCPCNHDQRKKIKPIIGNDEIIPEHKNDIKLVEFFSKFFQKLADKNNFNGVVLFAREDKIFFHRAWGIANRESNQPITTSTKFNLASASKMFTAVAIAKLAEEGKLIFDDNISQYLDTSWISKEIGRKILIKHLLSHTSGLGLYWEEFDKHSGSIIDIDDYKSIISTEPSFKPGTEGKYSNTGFILLGAIIEAITGQSYYEYVQKLIFKPLNMDNTGFFMMNEPNPNLAVGYYEDKENDGILKNNLDLHGIRGSSAGGCWSTAKDMHHFMRSFASDKLITSNTKKILLTLSPFYKNYGHGIQVKKGWIGHWGGFPGIEAFVMYYPQTGHTLIVFSNYYDSSLPFLNKLKYIYKVISRG